MDAEWMRMDAVTVRREEQNARISPGRELQRE